eukprot:XP_027311716.1 uncharacterized protein LOC113843461 isoform X3 [Anas platyrhynchos]
MSGKPPRRPRVAWVDSWATPIDESSYITPEDEEEEEVAVPRGPFDDLEVYVLEEEAVRTIDEFVKTWMEIPQGEEQKMKFLESICSVCTTARESGLSGGFADFCNRCNLCRHLQRLIEKEPLDQLETAVREQAMLAVAALSSLQVISEDSMQRLLTACFRSVFMLPPKEKLSAHNFVMTMHAMDSMLQLLLLSPPTTSFPSKLQSIVKALLRFCTSTSALPRRRAMMRLHKIGDFLGKCSSLEPFGRYLLEQQRTDLMLTCLEVVSHEVPEEDEQWVSFLLNAAREDPISWFASVPHFVIFFRKKLVEELTPAVRQKLLEVLVLMTRCYPHSVTMSILFICPSRLRSSMEMWEEIFSTPGMPKKLLNEICMLLRDNTIRAHFGMTEDYEILQLGLMQTLSPEDPIPAVLQDVECLKRCIRNTNFHLLWIALKGLAAMLERPKMVSAPPHTLPHTPCPSPSPAASSRPGLAAVIAGANGDYPAARRPENPAVRQPPHHGGGAGGVLQGPARPDEEVGQHHFPAAGRSAHALLGQRGRHGAGECHEALQRVHGARAVEAPQKDVEESAQRPADPLPPHERGEPERGQGCPGSPDGRVRAAVVGRAARSGTHEPDLEDQSLPASAGPKTGGGASAEVPGLPVGPPGVSAQGGCQIHRARGRTSPGPE